MIDFSAHKHPVIAVACPLCQARAGTWCKRPSGHKAGDFHAGRKAAADAAWTAAGSPHIGQGVIKGFSGKQPADPDTAPAGATLLFTIPEKPDQPPVRFAAMLDALDLRQVDFVRLLALLGGPGDLGTVNRWARERIPTPAPALAMLRLFGLLTADLRKELLWRARKET